MISVRLTMFNARFGVGLIWIVLTVSCTTIRNSNKELGYYNIFGQIEGKKNGYIYLQVYDTTEREPYIDFDSAEIRNSFFHIKGRTRVPTMAKLNLNAGRNLSFTNFFVLDTAVTKVILFSDSMSSSILEGSALNVQLLTFNRRIREMRIAFEKKYITATNNPTINKDSLNKLEELLDEDIFQLVLTEIENNPHSIVSSFVADREGVISLANPPAMGRLLEAFEGAENFFVRKLQKELAAMERTGIGKRIPPFKVVDQANQIYTNKSLKGRYLFLNFWASWCRPCREENPGLARVYDRFKNTPLRMISVSVDANPQNWLKAISQDGMKWAQVLADTDGKMEDRFDVRFIPYNYLVNPRGKIIGKNISPSELEAKLNSILFHQAEKPLEVNGL